MTTNNETAVAAHNTIEATASGQLTLSIGRTGEKAKFQGRTITLALADLPPEAVRFALVYGLKQYIADGTAGSEDQAGYDLGMTQRIEKLSEGDFTRKSGERGPRADTPEGRAKKLAAAAIRAKLAATGQKAEPAKISEFAAKMVETQPVWLDRARKALAEEAKLADNADLGDIFADMMGLTDDEQAAEEALAE